MSDYKKEIGLVSAIGLGVSAIIGSGWLFAPYQASIVAGPASVFSWIIAAVIISFLGLCFAEIASLYPKRGLSAIIPILSHDRYFAFPFSIANWLGVVAVIGLEADATNQYLINLVPTLQPLLFKAHHLTLLGNLISIALVIFFGIVNFWGAKTLVKANNMITVLKVLIPIVIGIAIIIASFQPANFHYHGESFVPYGYNSIFSAILTCGIVVAFNGFQTIIAFANDIKKPSRTIPWSIVIAVMLCLGIYLLLEVAMIGALPSKLLTLGWRHLNLYAPIIQVLGFAGLGFLYSVAYFGATVAPVGTGITFAGTSSRMFTAMSANKQMPSYFKLIDPVYGISRRSLVFNIILAICFLLLFNSWENLAEVLGLLHVISYLPVPIALWTLRSKIIKSHYSFRLFAGRLISYLLFLFFTYLFTMADLAICIKVMVIFSIFFFVYLLSTTRNKQHFIKILRRIWLLMLYFGSLIFLTILSPTSFPYILPTWQHIVVTVLLGSLFFYGFLRTARPDIHIIGLHVRKPGCPDD